MRSILIGNGFNIEIGGEEYLNRSIINRVLNNVKTKDYATKLFENSITNAELEALLPGMYDQLRRILCGEYDGVITDSEDKALISTLKSRYNIKNVRIENVGMEDYFIILRLYHKLYNDNEGMIRSTHDGFCWMFLDAVYNEGKIQNLFNQMDPETREFCKKRLDEFDSVFTTNYDCNIEKISGTIIYYLHGDFSTLWDQYDPTTLIGYCWLKEGNKNPVNGSNNYIYSNALMGFSGSYKEHVMDILENGQKGVEYVLELYKNNVSNLEKTIEKYRCSKTEEERRTYHMLLALRENPELCIHRYPMKEFKHLKGELYLLGISPSNDEHIWNAILKNPDLTKIVFYYHRETSKQKMQEMFSDVRLVYKSEKEFWKVK